MTKIFAWCDSPQAPTGFGRSAKHVLTALRGAGFEIVQLAVNQDPSEIQNMPHRTYIPLDRGNDPYGLMVLPELIRNERPDMMWTTFDPEVPWRYPVPGVAIQGRPVTAIDYLTSLRASNPGFKMLGWFPVDAGPLSPVEMMMLGAGTQFDFCATMSTHVYGLMERTLKLQGRVPDSEGIRKRLKVIAHGVELERYPMPSDGERKAAKRALGLPENAFIIAQVERNQQRKQNYLGLHVLEDLFRRDPKLRDKVILYQHMMPNEDTTGCQLGYDLPQLCWRYGLRAGVDVRWPQTFFPEDKMPGMYAAADAFLSTSAGEGFQYPAWEALACGVPLVVPDNSARTAWFSKAPNVTLYRCDDELLVLKNAYQRRMGMPSPSAAGEALLRIIRKGTSHKDRIRGRTFVAENASVGNIQAAWVAAAKEQEAALYAERKAAQIVVPADVTPETVTVVMVANPGLGDLIMAAPAIAALREARGTRVHLRVPLVHLDPARALACADAYETMPTASGVEISLDDLYEAGPKNGWELPTKHRTDTIAERLSVPVGRIGECVVSVQQPIQDTARARFLDVFGIDPTTCVVVALQDPDPSRALPDTYVPQICNGVRSMGLTPVLLGYRALGYRHVGVVDLTGQADPVYQMALIEQVAAVVAADNDQMHIAGAVATPLVACLTVVTESARLKYYSGERQVVRPNATDMGGESYPAGYGAKQPWSKHLQPDRIIGALRTLLRADGGPRIILPGQPVKPLQLVR